MYVCSGATMKHDPPKFWIFLKKISYIFFQLFNVYAYKNMDLTPNIFFFWETDP